MNEDPLLNEVSDELLGPEKGKVNPSPSSDPLLDEVGHELAVENADTIPQQVLAGAEGFAHGALGPIATAGERALHEIGVPGLSPEEQEARKEAHPWTSGLSEVAGFITPGAPQAKFLGAAGKAGAAALGLGAPVTPVAKIGSKAIQSFIDFSLFESGNKLSKLINGADPEELSQTALSDIGLTGALGSAIGVGGLGVSALWKAKVAPKYKGILDAFSKRYGGIEGIEPTEVESLLHKADLEFEPTVMGALSDDPAVKDLASILNQTDNSYGHEVQKNLKEAFSKTAEVLTQDLGTTVEKIPEKFDVYTAGNKLGKEIAEQAKMMVDPTVKQFENLKTQFSEIPLVADEVIAGHVPKPGIISQTTDNLQKLAVKEGWHASPSSESMREVNRVIEELPLQKTVRNLDDLVKSVNAKFDRNAGNWTFNRSLELIADVLEDSQAEALSMHAFEKLPKGETASLFKESNPVLKELGTVKNNFKETAKIFEPLMDRLGLSGSVSGFPRRLSRMVHHDSESILKKLSGKNDVELLNHLSTHFPEAANSLRQAHVEELLSKAYVKGELSPFKIIKGLRDLSPQMKAFLTQGNQEKIDAIGQIIDRLADPKYNFPNTARTAKKSEISRFVPATIVGAVSAFTGHSAPAVALSGYLAHRGFSEGPDAVRLAMLKWLGSNKPIDAPAFKSMLNFFEKVDKGESKLVNYSKSIFDASVKVTREDYLTHRDQLEQLDKKVQQLELAPHGLEKVSGNLGYYLQHQDIAMTASVARAVKYLNSIRPKPQKLSPLDSEIMPSKQALSNYNRVLKIAQQPLMVLDLLKQGTLTVEDVNHLKNLYPGFYTRLNKTVMDELINHLASGGKIPFRNRFGLSMILGQPMDSALQPQNIQANQAVFQQNNQALAEKNQVVKPTAGGLGKMKPSSRATLTPSDSGN